MPQVLYNIPVTFLKNDLRTSRQMPRIRHQRVTVTTMAVA